MVTVLTLGVGTSERETSRDKGDRDRFIQTILVTIRTTSIALTFIQPFPSYTLFTFLEYLIISQFTCLTILYCTCLTYSQFRVMHLSSTTGFIRSLTLFVY